MRLTWNALKSLRSQPKIHRPKPAAARHLPSEFRKMQQQQQGFPPVARRLSEFVPPAGPQFGAYGGVPPTAPPPPPPFVQGHPCHTPNAQAAWAQAQADAAAQIMLTQAQAEAAGRADPAQPIPGEDSDCARMCTYSSVGRMCLGAGHSPRAFAVYRSDRTLECYLAFLQPLLEDCVITLDKLLTIERQRLEHGISQAEHELVLLASHWNAGRFLKSLDADAYLHMRQSGQIDELGQPTRIAAPSPGRALQWYGAMLQGVLVDGVIDAREWALLRNARLAHGIAAAEHRAAMLQEGVTQEMEDALWAHGKDVIVSSAGLRRSRGGGIGCGFGKAGGGFVKCRCRRYCRCRAGQ